MGQLAARPKRPGGCRHGVHCHSVSNAPNRHARARVAVQAAWGGTLRPEWQCVAHCHSVSNAPNRHARARVAVCLVRSGASGSATHTAHPRRPPNPQELHRRRDALRSYRAPDRVRSGPFAGGEVSICWREAFSASQADLSCAADDMTRTEKTQGKSKSRGTFPPCAACYG